RACRHRGASAARSRRRTPTPRRAGACRNGAWAPPAPCPDANSMPPQSSHRFWPWPSGDAGARVGRRGVLVSPGRCRLGLSRRELRALRGFVFDLDGCVWTGDVLVPGAAEGRALLREQGRGGSFPPNTPAARSATMQAKLERLGVQAALPEVLTPLEILGEVIDARWGPSRVLVIGTDLLGSTLAESGHTLVPMDRFREAQVVVVGRDPDFTYDRLTSAARAIAGGAPFLTPNLDPRLPLEDGDFLPGCGAVVEAVAAAAGARPIVVGKPEPPLFELALSRMGVTADTAAMVGDSVDSDIRGARRVGMTAILFAPDGGPGGAAHFMGQSLPQLRRLRAERWPPACAGSSTRAAPSGPRGGVTSTRFLAPPVASASSPRPTCMTSAPTSTA